MMMMGVNEKETVGEKAIGAKKYLFSQARQLDP
jgi:hypothetical protein